MAALATTDVLIIVADDATRGVVGDALSRHGVSWSAAVEGADALERVERTRYAVMLLDLMMPGLDAAQLVTALRRHGRVVRERPVVLIVTAAFPPREPLPGLGEHVQAVVHKPFDAVELADIVRACVAGRRELGEDSVISRGPWRELAPPIDD